MPTPNRIAAGAIVFNGGRVLLVRYSPADLGTYLVAPGGAVEEGENLADAAAREVAEETGLLVAVRRPLAIEELQCSRFRMCKIWFLCDFVSGEVRPTEDARNEGITEARWFGKDELQFETVYPSLLCRHDWPLLASSDWPVECSELRQANL
jgi:8-oxo-dGTP diphosphatase